MRIGRLGFVGVVALVAACGSDEEFRVGGTVSGLKGQGLTLQNNGGDTLAVQADGPFTFATPLNDKAAYAVTVASQPTHPNQTCTVQNGGGTVSGAAVTGVSVKCATSTFAVGGTLSGATGSVVIQLNENVGDLFTANGPFTFSTRLEDGSAYTVKVAAVSGDQECTVANGSGTVQGADVTSVQVTCAVKTYSIGGTVNGLNGGTLELRLGSGETLPVTAAGPFTFQTKLTKGTAYAVSIATQPQGQRCAVSKGSGTVTGNVQDISVQCTPFFDVTTFQNASVVVGQKDFASIAAPGTPGAGTLDSPSSSPVLAGGKLYVADYNANRVLGFDGLPAQSGANASFVLGQQGFTGNAAQSGQKGLFGPQGLSSDGSQFAVADTNHHRVLLYSALPTATGAAPDFVVGQADFDSGFTGCDAASFNIPKGVFLGHGKLIVADSFNSRVLIWNTIPSSNAAPADLVLGQTKFTTCARNDADGDGTRDATPSATTLSGPSDVWTDGTRLVVADTDNHRVLIWNQFPTGNGQAADVVLGQASFTTGTAATTASGMRVPAAVASAGSQLFVADSKNNRVLVWNQFPTATGAAADAVLGQPDFTTSNTKDPSSGAAASARTLSQPSGVLLSWPHILVTDTGNNRLLVY